MVPTYENRGAGDVVAREVSWQNRSENRQCGRPAQAEHGRPVERARKVRRKIRAPFSIAAKRVNEIAALVRHRHGSLPDTDDRDIYLESVAHHLKPRDGDLWFALREWTSRVGIVSPDDEISWIVAKVRASPRRFRADTLGKRLRLTDAERTALKITTIGCFDVSKDERTRRRNERRRLAQQRRRRARGAITREKYLAASLSRQQPWALAGVSRATWYRHRSKGK